MEMLVQICLLSWDKSTGLSLLGGGFEERAEFSDHSTWQAGLDLGRNEGARGNKDENLRLESLSLELQLV